ncbi:hypothetical protein tb265_05120 [Gemmatimonadetes bacterium T265]|nr:hypothetical protein tb265_05120 [Gemmatimonadetes bacterium T265]
MTDHIETLGRPKSLLEHLESADPEIAERLVSRRAAVAAGVGLASAPVMLAALARDAFGQAARLPAVVISVLNFALTLEYLERDFYVTAVGTSGLIPASDQPIFNRIRDHEVSHVSAILGLLGTSARPKPTFDFTAHGAFPTVFSDYATFLAVSQAFEDTGVRAYKGQAPALFPYKSALSYALQIHSVEARHASEVRRLRGQRKGDPEQAPNKGWITEAQTDIPGTQATYAGEDNTVEGGVDLTTISTASRDNITEAFDEPLTMAQVLAIAGNFIAVP